MVGVQGPVEVLRGVQGGFDVGAVGVGAGPRGEVVELGAVREHVPQQGALVADGVDVEARVRREGRVVDHLPEAAARVGWGGGVEEDGGLGVRGWVGEVGGQVVCVAARLVQGLEVREEGGVEVHHVVVGAGEGHRGDFLLGEVPVADAGVV